MPFMVTHKVGNMEKQEEEESNGQRGKSLILVKYLVGDKSQSPATLFLALY